MKIIQYKWAGSWGPFKISIPCGECAVTENIITDVIETEFREYKNIIEFEVLDWLPNWWRIILRGGWHAPIITVNQKVIFQGQVLDRGYLASVIRKELVTDIEIPKDGVILFSKQNCKHCKRAKESLDMNNIKYTIRDVVADPLAAVELFHHTKKFFPKNKPVTTPQIWIQGVYIGGADELEIYFKKNEK